jgi:nucleoside-diphosphate-sugar epimerase
MKKTLLTGGSGFIGSHFHNAFDNESLINLDLVKPDFNYKSIFIQGDIRKESDVSKAVQNRGIERIISLAAKHHDFGIGHDEYFDTNEDGTRVICKVAEQNDINEIIFYSSVAVYGSLENASNEQIKPNPSSPYGASKLAGERVLLNWAKNDPRRKLIIMRPVVVFGENNYANMYSLIRQIDSGFYFHLGKADNIKSIAYVENLVQATIELSHRLENGVHIFNYADEPQLTTRQISTFISEKLGSKIQITLPMGLALILALPFDWLIKLSGRNLPISTDRIKKLGTQTLHSGKKVTDLGFTPKYSTLDGLSKMVSWYLSKKK